MRLSLVYECVGEGMLTCIVKPLSAPSTREPFYKSDPFTMTLVIHDGVDIKLFSGDFFFFF